MFYGATVGASAALFLLNSKGTRVSDIIFKKGFFTTHLYTLI